MPEDKKVITQNVNNSFWFENMHDSAIATYASGEVVGTPQSIDVRGQGGGGVARVIIVANNESQAFPLRIHFFRRQPSAFADGDTYIPIWPNDVKKFARYIDVAAGNYETYGTIRLAQLPASNVDFSCPTDGRLWYIIEARGAATFAAANAILINIGDWPD